MRPRWVMLLFALCACADFAEAEAMYCSTRPEVCPTRDAGAPDGGR